MRIPANEPAPAPPQPTEEDLEREHTYTAPHMKMRTGGPPAVLAGLIVALGAAAFAQSGGLTFTSYYDRALTLPGLVNRFLASPDFNGDGLPDLLVGSDDPNTLEKTPIYVLINLGDGRFREATAEFIDGSPRAAAPFGVTADFNNDGLPDVAVFDQGNIERGQHTNPGGFFGEAPLLLVSERGRRWKISRALADAVLQAKQKLYPTPAPDAVPDSLHIKYASAGDIDNDGNVDMYVESGGGYQYLNPHFMMNNGDGTFTVDYSEARVNQVIIHGDPPWRYLANQLVDLNGDGALDLVMGQLRRAQNGQERLASVIVFNDGAGHFRSDRVVNLPYANFFNGWTYVTSMAAGHLDGDGIPDLILAHTRGFDDDHPDQPPMTGRYIQVLMSRGPGVYVDETAVRMGDQWAMTYPTHPVYGANQNLVSRLRLMDVNGDGLPDLFMEQSYGIVSSQAPLIHLNDGRGLFRVFDTDVVTQGRLYFGPFAFPVRMNGDAAVDFLYPDRLPGPDGRYGTPDDITRLVPTIGAPR